MTVRTYAQLQTIFADNTTYDISAADIRDLLDSVVIPLVGVAAPNAGAGVAAPQGSQYNRNNAGTYELWFKTGAADNAWTKIV